MGINVRKEVISGTKWNTIGQVSNSLLQFIVSIILARILLPEEFGLIGMLTVFMGLADVFINSGLGAALIQKRDIKDIDYSTVFLYNILLSFILYFLFYLTAPLIASFYSEPILVPLTRWMGIIFVINGIGTVQQTILKRSLNFKKLNIVNVIGVIFSSIIAIILAKNGYGVYSILAQLLAFSIITNILFWITSSWKPTLTFSVKSFKSLFGFGSKLLLSSILHQVYISIDTLIIGKVFSAGQLGFFTRAKSTRDIPIKNSTNILTSIVFPIFSKLEGVEELKKYHLKFLGLIAYVIFPIMGGIFITADTLIITLYTEKWAESIPMLKILSFAGAFMPLGIILTQTVLAKGKSGVFLKMDLIKKTVGFLGMLVGLMYGIYGFIWGVFFAGLINLIINLIYTGKETNTGVLEYVNELYKSMIITVGMCLGVYFISMFFPSENFIKLITLVGSGVLIYFAFSAIFRIPQYVYLKELLVEKYFKKK